MTYISPEATFNLAGRLDMWEFKQATNILFYYSLLQRQIVFIYTSSVKSVFSDSFSKWKRYAIMDTIDCNQKETYNGKTERAAGQLS